MATFEVLAAAITESLTAAFTAIEQQPTQLDKDMLQAAIFSAVSRTLSKPHKEILLKFLMEDTGKQSS